MDLLTSDSLVQLAQWREIIQNPETAPVSPYHEVVVLDHQIANRCDRKIKLERLPVLTVIEGKIDSRFSSRIQQTLFALIFVIA